MIDAADALMSKNDLQESGSGVRKLRARDLGIPFDGNPGPFNAITDVSGVEVGYRTLVNGEADSKDGARIIRTGVTAVLPRGKASKDLAFAGWFALNGNGEMTGTTWIEESGFLEGPVLITNTHSVGIVRDAVIEWQVKKGALFQPFSLPVVAETFDGYLNDINGFHITKAHVFEAIEGAHSGAIAEGNIGGGTGMICYEFKGGTGTSSRRLSEEEGSYMIGALVQANHGRRYQLQVAGVPVGKEIAEDVPSPPVSAHYDETGSIIIVIATDAPLLPHQLKRLAKRAALGVARTGGVAGNGSGDIFVAFSTANSHAAARRDEVNSVQMISNERLNPIFEATILSTEEAIINAMVAAETMTGIDGHRVHAIPHRRLMELMEGYRRSTAP